MALTNCKHCGHLISDKAISCPKCGAAQTSPDKMANGGRRSNKAILTLIPIIGVLICAIIWLIVYINRPASKTIDPSVHSENIKATDEDSSQQDRLALSERQRIDSIKKIEEFKSFTTPDLVLFEAHGHVKSISNYCPLAYYSIFNERSNAYHFNEDGECEKIGKDDYFRGFKYDSEGRIVGGIFAESGGYPVLELKWNADGRLKQIYDSYGMHNVTTSYTYNSDGDLTQSVTKEIQNGFATEIINNYTIAERDHYGNWIKRKVSSTVRTENYNDSVPSTSKSRKTTVENRQIEYYQN